MDHLQQPSPLPACSGDCDTSQECFGDLLCFERSGTQAVPGCSGTGTSGKDYCYKPNGENSLAYTGDNGKPARSFPLGKCEGDCDTNADCASGLACFQRVGSEAVPGCSGAGLDARIIATEGQPVIFANGQQSSVNLHINPDGAAVFVKNDNSGNYFYVSNSEVVGSGGVGSIEFDSNGNVVGYKRVLSGTNNNCSGGRSPYNTWLSCEEYGTSGFTWEVSPEGAFVGRKTNLVPYGGIDIKDGVLYFVSKVDKTLFILQLRQGTFTKESTNQGVFNNQPDQVGRLIGSDPGSILYFCEDGGTYCGVHGRDPTGKYVTIIDNDPATTTFSGETTGLAFSPDGKRMYVSFQTPGIIFEISRLDGLSFGGALLDIKYHSSDPAAYWS
ncbi:Bacterial protein of unknown function (DUF839) [Fragilaria crotonensis]|nr:Bacterial protein of unknown function (DUF839) [Fragilaria crotonensis]